VRVDGVILKVVSRANVRFHISRSTPFDEANIYRKCTVWSRIDGPFNAASPASIVVEGAGWTVGRDMRGLSQVLIAKQ